MSARLLAVFLLALATVADAADPVGYSFVVYWPSLMSAPFAFRGEGHTDLRQCNRVRALVFERLEQATGGPGKFTGTFGLCTVGGATIAFPSE